MSKPTKRILSGDEGQCLGDGLLQVLTATSAYPSQKAFQLGESFFNRREIGRISRQKQQTTAASFNGLPHTRREVNREIIQDHDLSSMQAGGQDLLNVKLKSRSISSSIQDERFSHPRERQGSDQRHDGSIVARDFSVSPLSSGSIGIQRGHSSVGAGFIHKHQILTEQGRHVRTPGGTGSLFLLACSQGLFFRVQPRAALARLMEAELTLIPVFSSHRRQCSSRLASGYFSSCSKRPACNAAPIAAGRPGIALGN